MSNLKKAIHEMKTESKTRRIVYRKQQSNWKCGSWFAIEL
jgi:hypothetical protein